MMIIQKVKLIANVTLIFLLSAFMAYKPVFACSFHGNLSFQSSDIDKSLLIFTHIIQARNKGQLDYNTQNDQGALYLFQEKLFANGFDGQVDYLQAGEEHLVQLSPENVFRSSSYTESATPLLITENDVLFHLTEQTLSWQQAETMNIASISSTDKQQEARLRAILNKLFPEK